MAKQMFRALVALLLTLPVWLYAAPRVITLSPANTELAFAAGITPVGVSSYSDYPPEAQKIEQVSTWQGMNLERIVALKPDLVVAMVTSMLTILLVRQPRRLPKWMLPVLDAVGLAVFVGIGVNKAFLAETGPLVAVCMGVITGVGGGIIRDVLAREIPMILRTEIYATACIIGGIVHATAFYTFSVPLESASMMGMVVTLFIRLAAIRWHLKLPTFALDENGR